MVWFSKFYFPLKVDQELYMIIDIHVYHYIEIYLADNIESKKMAKDVSTTTSAGGIYSDVIC